MRLVHALLNNVAAPLVALTMLYPSGSTVAQSSGDTCLYVGLEPTWSYLEADLLSATILSQVKYVGDSLVGSRTASVLAKFDVAGERIESSALVTFYRDGILEFWRDGAWSTVYDLSAPLASGDTTAFAFPPTTAEVYDVSSSRDYRGMRYSYDYVVQFPVTPPIDLPRLTTGHSYYFLQVDDGTDESSIDVQTLTPGLGSSAGFFGQHPRQLTLGSASALVCFEARDTSYDVTTGGCALLSSLRQVPAQPPTLALYPNPVPAERQAFRITGLRPEHTVVIVNPSGQALVYARTGEELELMEVAPVGLYFVHVRDRESSAERVLPIVIE